MQSIEIHHARLCLLQNGSIVASPQWVFAKHVEGAGDNQWTVQYKDLRPQSTATEDGDSFIFSSVAEEDRVLLTHTLESIVRFNHQLRCMVGELCKEIPSSATVDTGGNFGDELNVNTADGEINLAYESDLVCIFAGPMDKVFGSRIRREHGPINMNMAETGVLSYCGQNFPGAESDDGSVVEFSFAYPAQEEHIMQLFRALLEILLAAEASRA
jgi:hypothetical protein